jgi:hypothetical protein
MKNKSQSNNENKITITLSWKTHLMQSDENSLDEILRQKHDTKIKRRKTTRNKNKVTKCCTWEAAADLNPNCEILTQIQGAQMKREKTTGTKNKPAKCCTWEAMADLNPNCEILRQKQGAKMKRRRTIRNKSKVANCCTWEAAANLNPNFERERQNLHRSSSVAVDETCGCHITIYSMTALWLFSD